MAEKASETRGLEYPLKTIEHGETQEVAPGVLRLRMPLPFSLDHINLYALEDEGGWTVVDTGLATDKSREVWENILAGPMGSKPVVRVLCTHMHPDHIGLAGWLCQRFEAPLHMSRLEYVTARMLIADTGREAPEAGVRFYKAAGWNDKQIERYRKAFGGFGRAVSAMPDAFVRIEDRREVTIGGRSWRVITGSGHSPEHVCLWQPEAKLFLAGDQVLPRISSHVGVFPTEPAADPLNDFLASCWRIMAAIPDDVLVLPSHGEPFKNMHKRLEALIEGHERRLSRLEEALDKPKRVLDVFGAMFARKIGEDDLGMATGETLAHLNYLVRRGRAAYEMGADGVARFVRQQAPAEVPEEGLLS